MNKYDILTKFQLQNWDFPDIELVRDGYDMASVPTFTEENFLYLVEKHNELVNFIAEELGKDDE